MNDLVDVAQIGGAVIALLALLVAVFSAVATTVNERRRVQPLVVAKEWLGPEDDGATVKAFMTNLGLGAAFNVRMGVRVGRNRVECRNNRIPVLDRGERRPEGEGWPVDLPAESANAAANRRFYWCRYENAAGKCWETEMRADGQEKLSIRKLKWARLRSWLGK